MVISPIEYMLELVFRLLLHFFTIKTSLIGMSIVVSLLCLPLYIRADAIQQEDGGWKPLRIEFQADGSILRGECDFRFFLCEAKRPEERVPKDVATLRHIIDVTDNAVAIWMACTETIFPNAVGGGYTPIASCSFRDVYAKQ